MAYPITGNKAKITCTSVSDSDLKQLFTNGVRDVSASLSWDAPALDSTPMTAAGVTTMESVMGLTSGTVDFEGVYPKTAPKSGISGNVTFASGYAARVQRYSLEITCSEEEITEQLGTAVSFRRFMPGGLVSWGGSFTCLAIDSTTVGLPSTVNGTGAEATFKLCEDGAADPSFGGSSGGLIMITGMSHGIQIGGKQEVTYTFKGSSTLYHTAGTNFPSLLYTGSQAVTTPSWDDSGNGTPIVTVQYFTGRTYAGDAFWTRLGIECTPGGLVRVRGSLRWDGAVTAA